MGRMTRREIDALAHVEVDISRAIAAVDKVGAQVDFGFVVVCSDLWACFENVFVEEVDAAKDAEECLRCFADAITEVRQTLPDGF